MVRRYELEAWEWEEIEPCLPKRQATGRPPRDPRQILNGVFWILRSGARWRDLPARYGPWKTVYHRFRTWQHDGVIECILRRLQLRLNEEGYIDTYLWCIRIPLKWMSAVFDWTRSAVEADLVSWPTTFAHVVTARDFAQFLEEDGPFRLIGLSLRCDDADDFLLESAGLEWPDRAWGPYGIMRRRFPPDPRGRLLGYELLSASSGNMTSWTFRGLKSALASQAGLTVTAAGLLGSRKEADRALALLREHKDVDDFEPGWTWRPWLLQESTCGCHRRSKVDPPLPSRPRPRGQPPSRLKIRAIGKREARRRVEGMGG